MAMIEPKPPQPFSASTFTAAKSATALRSRIEGLADRLAGQIPRPGENEDGATLHTTGVMEEVEAAGHHIETCIQDIHRELDRIANKLG